MAANFDALPPSAQAFADSLLSRGGWLVKANRRVANRVLCLAALDIPMDYAGSPKQLQSRLEARAFSQYKAVYGCGVFLMIILSALISEVVRLLVDWWWTHHKGQGIGFEEFRAMLRA